MNLDSKCVSRVNLIFPPCGSLASCCSPWVYNIALIWADDHSENDGLEYGIMTDVVARGYNLYS